MGVSVVELCRRGSHQSFGLADLTYGEQEAAPPPQLTFQLYAELQTDVAGPWNDPLAAATCFRSVTGAELATLGRATTGVLNVDAWAAALWPALAPIRAKPECTASFTTDQCSSRGRSEKSPTR